MTSSARSAEGRRPTMRDVAAAAGVSQQTVSLVLRGEPGPSTASRERVRRAAEEIGYRANVSARLLRRRRSRLIGMLYAAGNTFELRVVERLMERAAEAGFDVVLGPVTGVRTTEVVVSQFLEQRVEALACYNPDPASPALRSAIASMPVVWMGEHAGDPRVDAVRTDDDRGLELLVEHLVERGHTRIAYAGGSVGIVGADRARAYRAAMAARGLPTDEIDVGFGEEDGARAARDLLARDELPTAVIGCSDHCAAGLMGTLVRAGVRIPDDVSITGYDDSDVAALSYLDITSVRQDVDLTVDAALAAILGRLADPDAAPQDRATAASLTTRSSTGPARA
ncbi:LacI family DNA-binding transcriptional regulator [Microbacterium indicum]|uniref:LacI family DNA-binding transcriptional regulator n=1 Tax=Microbacterium indicum TaxID=358100 RepID=UPI0004238024|nr:LacI family DNA-binding transcriptional regulator [Microbacterium indicum]